MYVSCGLGLYCQLVDVYLVVVDVGEVVCQVVSVLWWDQVQYVGVYVFEFEFGQVVWCYFGQFGIWLVFQYVSVMLGEGVFEQCLFVLDFGVGVQYQQFGVWFGVLQVGCDQVGVFVGCWQVVVGCVWDVDEYDVVVGQGL